MSSIILAFIFGVLAGMGYMYLRYCKMIRNNLKELEEIRLSQAKTEGMLEALGVIVNGPEKEESK